MLTLTTSQPPQPKLGPATEPTPKLVGGAVLGSVLVDIFQPGNRSAIDVPIVEPLPGDDTSNNSIIIIIAILIILIITVGVFATKSKK